jgi:hypothetical protein
MNYLWMNILALLAALVVASRLRKRRQLARIVKISLLVVPLCFPWLYFGISREAWSHGDPGPLFMGVPANEIALSFIMTFVNSGILLLNYRAILHESHRSTERKDSRSEDEEDRPSGVGCSQL